jgi:hypothetical protein
MLDLKSVYQSISQRKGPVERYCDPPGPVLNELSQLWLNDVELDQVDRFLSLSQTGS